MRSRNLIVAAILLGIVTFWLESCATPSSPTGGPPDEEGPSIVMTEPETGTTNFDRQNIILHFSEFVNRSSLNEALVIEPEMGIDYELDWGRKSVKIVFDRELPDSTTLIVTIGTEFKDYNGNPMSAPQRVAVSTGPEIDSGQIIGRVINASTGEGEEGNRMLLYREPVDLSETADYIASTDTGGSFQFSYLSEGNYKIFWVEDRNRNKIWEPEQERAQPFSKETIELEKEGVDTLGTVFIVDEDTTKPVLQGLGLFSSQRMRMRFSEDIQLTDTVEITVTDSVGAEVGSAIPLYIDPDDPFILFAHSEQELDEEKTYSIRSEGIVDNNGNSLQEITTTFTGSSQEDTTQQRIVKRTNLSGYFPADPVEITYAKMIDEESITDSVKVIEGTELVEDWPVETENNILRIPPDEAWKEVDYEIRLWDPFIEDYRMVEPSIWHESELGTLAVFTEDSTAENIHLTIENEESGIQRDTVFADQVEIADLPPLNYKVRAFKDVNSNNRWDEGQVDPFVKPEPFFIQTNVPVRSEMTSDLTITFRDE